MKKVLYLSFLLATSFFFSQCSKDESPSDILQDNKWRIVGWLAEPAVEISGKKYSDLISIIDACTKDNFIQFKSDKTLLEDEGPTKCNSTDPQTSNAGKWDLSEDAKSLYLNDTDLSGLTGTVQAVVNKLDHSELNISLNITFVGQAVKLTLSLKPV